MGRLKNSSSSMRRQKEETTGTYVFKFKGRYLRDLLADEFIFFHELEGGSKGNPKRSR